MVHYPILQMHPSEPMLLSLGLKAEQTEGKTVAILVGKVDVLKELGQLSWVEWSFWDFNYFY